MNTKNFFKFERKNDDFPFYNYEQSPITLWKGVFIFIALMVGFILFTNAPFIPEFLRPFLNIIFPFTAFYIVVGKEWTKLFRPMVPRDIIIILGTLLVNILVSFIGGLVLSTFFGAVANPAGQALSSSGIMDKLLIFAEMIPELIGEELLTIIPFLLLLQLATKWLKLSRKTSVILAWILVSVFFGALHLQTYGWNIAQAIIGIGVARVILLYPYIKTKNMWLTIIVHILNDWILFALVAFR